MNKSQLKALECERIDLSKDEILDIIGEIRQIFKEDKEKFKDQLSTLEALELFIMFRSDKDISDIFRGIIWFVDHIRYQNTIKKDMILDKIKGDFKINYKSLARELFA